MESKKINIDYIGVVKEDNGAYKFEQVPIIKSHELKDSLQAMCKNPNRTLLDMQEAFAMKIKSTNKSYRCCLPYSYSDCFISEVCYPAIKSYEIYKEEKQAKITEITNEVEDTSGHLSEFDKRQKINASIMIYEQQLKEKFLNAAIRYIEAIDFTATWSRIKEMKDTKMSSHEFIGWTTKDYRINGDLAITVYTNFGYGESSHFFVNVNYKGIDLLPYSQMVNYYYAKMKDIVAYTRSYRPERDSWQIALDFVAEMSDKSKMGLEKLVYEWLRNEITELITGLRHIRQNTKQALTHLLNHAKESGNLISVRKINNHEIAEYEVYPNEIAFIFQVEKISNALCFLKKLEQAAIVYEDAIEVIEEIEEMNIAIAPEIQVAVARLHNEILVLREQELNPIERKIEAIRPQKEAMENQVKTLHEMGNKHIAYDDFKKIYIKQHPEYQTICSQFDDLSTKRAESWAKISARNRFIERLQRCFSNIAASGLLAA